MRHCQSDGSLFKFISPVIDLATDPSWSFNFLNLIWANQKNERNSCFGTLKLKLYKEFWKNRVVGSLVYCLVHLILLQKSRNPRLLSVSSHPEIPSVCGKSRHVASIDGRIWSCLRIWWPKVWPVNIYRSLRRGGNHSLPLRIQVNYCQDTDMGSDGHNNYSWQIMIFYQPRFPEIRGFPFLRDLLVAQVVWGRCNLTRTMGREWQRPFKVVITAKFSNSCFFSES